MANKTGLIVLIVILITFCFQSLASRKIQLPEVLRAELSESLKVANFLHEACYQQKTTRIENHLNQLEISFKRVKTKSVLAKEGRTHLDKILNAALSDITHARESRENNRRQSLKKVFNHIVQVAKTYKIYTKRKYKIFFCPKDKAVWLQESWQARNPINPKRWKKCGQPVG